MTRKEIVELRAKFLKQMDDYVRDSIGDETITDYWLSMGLPDGADDDEIREIAEDDEEWVEMVEAFAYCLRMEEEFEEGDE